MSHLITHNSNTIANIANKIGIGLDDASTNMHLEEKLQFLKIHFRNLQHKRLLLLNAKKKCITVHKWIIKQYYYCLVGIPPKVAHIPKAAAHKKHPTNILHEEKHAHR